MWRKLETIQNGKNKRKKKQDESLHSQEMRREIEIEKDMKENAK